MNTATRTEMIRNANVFSAMAECLKAYASDDTAMFEFDGDKYILDNRDSIAAFMVRFVGDNGMYFAVFSPRAASEIKTTVRVPYVESDGEREDVLNDDEDIIIRAMESFPELREELAEAFGNGMTAEEILQGMA